MPHSLTISERNCASRFCSTTNTKSCSPMKLVTLEWNGNARTRSRSSESPRAYHRDRLVHGGRGRAVIDDAVLGGLAGIGGQRPRHQILRGLELAQEPLHVVGVSSSL